MAMRWRWPPESLTPRSPTIVAMPSRQRHDEIAAARGAAPLPTPRRPRRPAGRSGYSPYRAVKQRDVLRHDRDGGAQALLRDARDILPVDQDAAGLHVVEALQQGEQRRLAAAGMTDQPDALARLKLQVEVLEDLLPVAVAERDVLELRWRRA